MMFPVDGDGESALPMGFRGVLYGCGMVYFFIGISIVADTFMSSIEQVTSLRIQRRAVDKSGSRSGPIRTSLVWNETVATLTLMALGSSAPEIFLSIIDIVKKRFHFGSLGPSTIVGSASFNLFVIIAVCIVVIPTGETRAIQNLPAFYITAFFSILAYVWMAFILLVTSPDIVEVWEAGLTFLMLPIMVGVSYKVDTGSGSGLLRRWGIIDAEEEDGGENEAGVFAIAEPELSVPGSEKPQTLEVVVLRRGAQPGALGDASCSWRTQPLNAVPGFDFEAANGTLHFGPGETERRLELQIMPKAWRLQNRRFLVIVDDAVGGPGFDPSDDGGEGAAIATIDLAPCGAAPEGLVRLVDRFIGVDALRCCAEEWKDQARDCLRAGDGESSPSVRERVAHYIALPWKVFFLFCPPVCLGGGWPCFVAALMGIALLTTGVSDLAELFGCVLGIPDIITAITFVALGTSMPDLFASLSAATEDPTADASIVNVTGSNSVNVFLGLGVPWSLAALYWKSAGRTDEWLDAYPEVAARISGAAFVVEAGDLAFSVIAFCYACLLALLLLVCRRRWLQAELGGPVRSKIASGVALMTFWFGWVALVSGEALRWGPYDVDVGEYAGVLLLAIVTSIVATGVALVLMRREAGEAAGLASSKTPSAAPQGVAIGSSGSGGPHGAVARSGSATKGNAGRSGSRTEAAAAPKEPADVPALDPEQIGIAVVDAPPERAASRYAPREAPAGCSSLYYKVWYRLWSG